jgi:hypothetical protein
VSGVVRVYVHLHLLHTGLAEDAGTRSRTTLLSTSDIVACDWFGNDGRQRAGEWRARSGSTRSRD